MATIIEYFGYKRISALSLLSKKACFNDKVWSFIEDLEGKQIVSINDEAKKYCYKIWSTGEIKVICREFVNTEVNNYFLSK